MSPGSVLTVGLAGPEPSAAERALLDELRPAGVILFARNVAELPRLAALARELDERLERPLLLIDQEGGRVDRLKGLVGPSPPARRLAAAGPEAVRRHATLMARAVRLAGLNFNCTPVVDLDEGHEGNGIGDRSFGADPARVAELAALVLEAHREQRVATSLKHFPGLGRTRSDTHEMRPDLSLTREQLEDRELRPYRLLAGRADSVMVCHAAFPQLAGGPVPSSLSAEVVDGLLRGALGHEGLVVTDDLEMGAVTDRPAGPRAEAALSAGCDLLLFCKDPEQARAAHAALGERAAKDESFALRLEEAGARVAALRRRVGGVDERAGSEDERAEIAAALEALTRRVGSPSA